MFKEIKWSIWLKFFVRRYVHYLKSTNEIILNSNTGDGLLSENRKASGLFHYPNDGRWLRYNYGAWWERRPAGLRAGLQTLQPRELSKEDFLYLFPSFNIWNTGILITYFSWLFLSRICGCFKFSGCNFKINMNNNNVKYLRVISFSQLTLAKKIEIRNLGRATTDLIVSKSATRTQTSMRKFNTRMWAQYK